MTLEEFRAILEQTGFPVAYSHFIESENNPLPALPFVIFHVTSSSNFSADNVTYLQMQNVDIELYTDRKDLEAENKLEALFIENEIPFASLEAYIESENMFQKIYEVRF